MAWLYLIIAGVLDATWLTLLKLFSFRYMWLGALIIATAACTPFLINLAMKALPLGTSYVALGGVIATMTVLFGIFFLGESISWLRLLFLALIVIGVIGLRLIETPAAAGS